MLLDWVTSTWAGNNQTPLVVGPALLPATPGIYPDGRVHVLGLAPIRTTSRHNQHLVVPTEPG